MGKKRTILAGVLSAMLILAGCGKQDAITDYGNGVDDHLTEETKGGVDSTAANTESEGDITETAATKSDLSKNELFGDKQIQWRDKFSVDDGKVNVDVYIDYNPMPIKELPLYKYTRASAAVIDEEKVVEKLFGDTAIQRTTPLDIEKGDSLELIQNYTTFLFRAMDTMGERIEIKTWAEEETFRVHTYEGQYKGTDAQMIFAYDFSSDIVFVSMCVKTPGDLIDHPDYKGMGTYFNAVGAEYYTGDDNSDDTTARNMTNKCDMSKEELIDTVSDFMEDTFDIHASQESFTTDGVIYSDYVYVDGSQGVVASVESEDPAVDVVFYSVDDDMYWYNTEYDYMTAEEDQVGLLFEEKNGYYVSLASDIGGFNRYAQGSYTNYYHSYEGVAANNQGGFYVNDTGVMGFSIIYDGWITERITESTSVLSFENLKAAFVTAVTENTDTSKLDVDSLYFKDMTMIYYGVPNPDNPLEGTLVPAIVINAMDGTFDRMEVTINIVDGSLISIAY